MSVSDRPRSVVFRGSRDLYPPNLEPISARERPIELPRKLPGLRPEGDGGRRFDEREQRSFHRRREASVTVARHWRAFRRGSRRDRERVCPRSRTSRRILVAARLERQAIIAVNELASAPSSRALEGLARADRERGDPPKERLASLGLGRPSDSVAARARLVCGRGCPDVPASGRPPHRPAHWRRLPEAVPESRLGGRRLPS